MLVNIVKQLHSYPSIMKISIIFTLFASGAIRTESYHLYSPERKHNMLVLCPSILMGTKCINCHIMHPISDGRPWNAYFNSKRGGFSGIRRHALCKGSPRCPNEMCWFKRPYGKENRVNFEERNGIKVCHSCNTEAEDVPCPAVKVWEVSEDKKWVTFYHHNHLTCNPVKKNV